MDLVLAAQERIGHPLVIHQIAQRLAHLGLGQDRIAHVDLEVDQGRLGVGLDDDVLVALEAGDLIGGEIACDVGVALLDQQPLRAGLGHVADDHALHRRRAVARVLRLEGHALVRLPAPQRERPRAGRVGLQPARSRGRRRPRAPWRPSGRPPTRRRRRDSSAPGSAPGSRESSAGPSCRRSR